MFSIRNASLAALLIATANAHKVVTPGGLRVKDREGDVNEHDTILEEGSYESAPVDRSMVPMTKEKLALVLHGMLRDDEIMNRAVVPEGCTQYVYHEGRDRMFTEEYGDDYCMVTWMGTNKKFKDWIQNIPWGAREIAPGCDVPSGLYQAYSGGDTNGFVEVLEGFVNLCAENGKQLVFNGHSQGAGAAGIAHTIFENHNPITLMFGNAPWMKNSDEAGNCVSQPESIWRFINSENSFSGIVYDVAPNGNLLVEWLGLDRASYSAGGYIVLPPGDVEGNMIPMTDAVSHVGPEAPEMDIRFDQIDILNRSIASSHDNKDYLKKIQDLYDQVPDGGVLDTSGFINESMCHAGEECHSGSCEKVRLLSTVTRCFPQKEIGQRCNENSDCLSGNCNLWRGGKCRP